MSSSSATSRTTTQASSMIWRFLISFGINLFLEWRQSYPVERVHKQLAVLAAAGIYVDDLLDHIRDFILGEGGAHDLPEGGVIVCRSTKGHLVEFLTLLVYPEDADVAHVMVPAGVHAAGDVQRHLADVAQALRIVEAALDRFRDRDRLGVGQGAEIATRAADDVGEQTQVVGVQTLGLQRLPDLVQRILLD